MKKILLLLLCLAATCITYAQRGQCGQNCDDMNSYSHSSPNSSINSQDITYAQPEKKVHYQVYPNPVVDFFKLEEEAVKEGNAKRLFVRRMDGQIAKAFTVANGVDYQIGDLQAGQYFIQLVDGKTRTVQTITVQKVSR